MKRAELRAPSQSVEPSSDEALGPTPIDVAAGTLTGATSPRVPSKRRRSHVPVSILLVGIVLILVAAAMYLALPAVHADFRIHAATTLIEFRAASDFKLEIDSSEWIATGVPGNGQSGEVSSIGRSLRTQPEAVESDMLILSVNRGDHVFIRAVPGASSHFGVYFPGNPVNLLIQPASDSPLVRFNNDGRETPMPSSATVSEIKIGGHMEPALQVNLPACPLVLHHESGARGETPPTMRLMSPNCPQEIGKRLPIDELSFGTSTSEGVEAGLLDGGLQFLDKPSGELALYNGTDLRLGNVDAEIMALELTKDAIGVYASGAVDMASLHVETRNSGVRIHSIMPTRMDSLKGAQWITAAVSVLASIVAVMGFVLSVASVIKPVGNWVHRTLGFEDPAGGSEN